MSMAFDMSKDKTLAMKAIGEIEVKLCQYNGGEPKIQITRFEQKGDTRVYGKLGRMTVAEARSAAEMVMEVSQVTETKA
jgi:hypothetical protein